MIRIKFEVEEQETEPLPIESENVGSQSDDKVVVPEKNGNKKKTKPTNFDQSMKQQQEIPIRIQQQQQQQSLVSTKIETIVPDNHQEAQSFLDQNSTMDSVAVGLNLIKTEPVESSLSLTTQLNHSLTIQSLLRQNRIQKGWTTNESTSSIGTKQQQQQSLLLLPKIEPIVPEIHQEVPLSSDLNSLIPNLDSEETSNYDTAEIQSLDQSALIPIDQQQFFSLPKTEPIFPEIHQDVPLSLDLSSLIPNLDSEESSNYDTAEIQSLDQNALIPIDQQQFFSLPKTEPIFPEIHQDVPLSLDLSSLIPNLDSEESSNYDTAEIQSLDQNALIPIEQQQQQSFVLPKIEPIFPEIHQEVPLSLDLNSLIPNPNLSETTTNCDTTEVPFLDQSASILNLNPNFGETTATNCDITTEMFPGPRAGLGRRAKLNVCYSVPKEPKPVPRRRKKVPKPSLPSPPSADNSESASNDNDQHSGSISGLDPSTSITTAQVAAPAEAVVPLLVGKKPLRRVPPLTLEEKKAHKREIRRLWYHRQRANPEIRAEILRRKSEFNRKYRQQRLANATPEQRELNLLKDREWVRRKRENETKEQRQRRLEGVRQYKRTVAKQRKKQLLASATLEQREQMRLKDSEEVRRHVEKQTEEQRQRRLEQRRQYNRTVGKQRKKQLLASATPEQREQMRLKQLESNRRHREKETEEQRQRRLERVRQYKQRMKQKTLTPEEREKKRAIQREYSCRYRNRNKESLEESQIGESQTSMSSSSINLVVMDNSESSTSTLNQLNHSSSTITSDNNGIVDIGTTISKRKRKPNKKHFELSMEDSDSFHFDIGGGGGVSSDESIGQTTLESLKPGPSKKLPRHTRNLKSQIYLEPSTDSDDSD